MSTLVKLREQARLHEQREEWDLAVQLYEEILATVEEPTASDVLPLFNRVGDLHLRLGQPETAVECYERAAVQYADAGFYNSAIALCSKALRHAPAQPNLLHRLATYCARQGFHTDARRWLLEFAEVQFRAEHLDEALSALEQFADTTEDPQLREALAERLEALGRQKDAASHLAIAYSQRLAQADLAGAEALRERVLELDPYAQLEPAVLPETEEAEEAGTGASSAQDWEWGSATALAGEPEPTGGAQQGWSGESEVRDPASGTEHDEVPDMAASYPGGAPEQHPGVEEDAVVPMGAEPEAESGLGEEVDVAGEAPTAGEEPEEEQPAPDGALADSLARVEELLTAGDQDGAVAELEALSAELAASGDMANGLDVVQGALELDPDNLRMLQAQVEFAARLGEGWRIVEAYQSLAAGLGRHGEVAKAQAVYRQILELDPENDAARAAWESLTETVSGEPGPDRTAEQVGRPVGPTRLVVREAEVSRSRGFEDVLAQFKAKVDETLGSEDPESHYDLGLAYKEMDLLDEAISEFRTALLGGLDRPAVYEELGQCLMMQERFDAAVRVLSRVAESQDVDAESLLGVNYHLGRCLEELGDAAAARAAFDRVLSVDQDFRDAAERAARL